MNLCPPIFSHHFLTQFATKYSNFFDVIDCRVHPIERNILFLSRHIIITQILGAYPESHNGITFEEEFYDLQYRRLSLVR